MNIKTHISTTIQCLKKAESLWKILYLAGGCVFFVLLYAFFCAIAEYAESCIARIIWSLLLSLCIYFIYSKIYKPLPRARFKNGFLDLARGFCIGIINLLLVFLCIAATGCYQIDVISWDFPQIISNLSLFLLVAVSEEIICRGILLRTIEQNWSLTAGIIVSAVVFGVWHWSNDNATVFSTINLMIDGCMFAFAFKYHDTLWLPIGMHWSWNFFQGSVLGFNVSGTESPYSVVTPVIEGKEIITGGLFGIEGSVFMIPVGLLFIWYFYYLYKRSKKQRIFTEESIQS